MSDDANHMTPADLLLLEDDDIEEFARYARQGTAGSNRTGFTEIHFERLCLHAVRIRRELLKGRGVPPGWTMKRALAKSNELDAVWEKIDRDQEFRELREMKKKMEEEE